MRTGCDRHSRITAGRNHAAVDGVHGPAELLLRLADSGTQQLCSLASVVRVMKGVVARAANSADPVDKVDFRINVVRLEMRQAVVVPPSGICSTQLAC